MPVAPVIPKAMKGSPLAHLMLFVPSLFLKDPFKNLKVAKRECIQEIGK